MKKADRERITHLERTIDAARTANAPEGVIRYMEGCLAKAKLEIRLSGMKRYYQEVR